MKYVDPKPGDLIEIFRLGYEHWAVYVGSGYVVHVTSSGDSNSKAMVKKEWLSHVAGRNNYRVNNKHDSTYPVRSPEEIVSMAEMWVGKKMEYNLFTENCEHFATRMRYNVSHCDQVLNAVKIVIHAVFTAGLLALKHDSKYPVRSPEEIVSMGEMLVGKKMEYNLFTQNCEHFATFLRYNVAPCDQVSAVFVDLDRFLVVPVSG
ncbi:phospholipase A and acyltransferase 2-like [Thamnophis elegans]|uniref:phospholipase A and acyltransferase 2-like n=1 Tax=Thamnophis elegans TaxID=35005 RepID=UPI0013790889|nr:phospholipase A and acyltransferase 2-like [Thamnophis elegans]